MALLVFLGVQSFPQSASAAEGNIRSPFESGGPVYIYQGYSSGTHTGTSQFGLDLTTGASSTSTAGRTVVAPQDGVVAYWQASYGNLCVNVSGGRSYTLTHINASVTSGSISAGQAIGSVGSAGSYNNNGVAHLHFEYWSAPGCYNHGSPLPFDSAHGLRICGAPDLPPSGPISNGVWGRTSFTADGCGPVGSAAPFGAFDAVDSASGGVFVRGWAIDPDTNDPIDVHVYVNGVMRAAARADQSRPDVDAVHHRGEFHGYSVYLDSGAGAGNITVYAINAGGGVNPELGTKPSPPSANPIGNLDSVAGVDGKVRLRGWTLDQDTTDPIAIHIYRNDALLTQAIADIPRSDVDAAFGRGPNHGFDVVVDQSDSSDVYKVYAINFGTGIHPQFGVSAAPVNLVSAPTISGTPRIGSVLKVSKGSWARDTLTYTYQWFRNGTPIPGAIGSSYSVVTADAKARLSAVVTVNRDGYASATATTAQTSAVTVLSFTTAPTPTISGTGTVGSTVKANAGTWTPSPTTITYQWKRNGTPISGATAATYKLVTADAGTSITVTTTAKKSGYTTASKTSAAKAVATIAFAVAPVPTISGTPAVGSTLTAAPGSWSPAAKITYQWKRAGASIPGATAATYKLVAADAGKSITVTTTATAIGRTSTSKTSATKAIQSLFSQAPTPTISGSATVGSTLTVKRGTWSPAADTYSYRWARNGTAISGATSSTYKLVEADAGAKLTVSVKATKSGYTSSTKTSAATTIASIAFTKAPLPTINGSVVVGETVSAQLGTWSPTPSTLKYQWKRNGVSISGAVNSRYTLAPADAGTSLTVVVTASSVGRITTSKTSGVTAVPAFFKVTPTPTISGQGTVGSTLTAAPGTWSPSPSTISYQWKRNGTAIPSATTSKYTLVEPDAGTTVTVTVTVKRSGYATTSKTSTAKKVATLTFTTAPTPTVSGSAIVGSTLTAKPGTWSPTPSKLTYQWVRGAEVIAGATASTYKLTEADAAQSISVTVTASRAGYASTARTSGPKTISPQQFTSAPIPIVNGDASFGSTLSADAGVWSPTPDTLAYQWSADGAPIGGATSPSYTVTLSEVGKRLTVTVNGSRAGFIAQAQTSAPTASVPALPTGTPAVQTQRMSAPNLTSTQAGWYGAGTPLTLVCHVYGQSVRGYFSPYIGNGGWDSLWYRVSDGYYVADVDLETGTRDPVGRPC
ncbi:hypothetical protein GCM10009851_05280 [Herbiconiux moechotypicola]|uniref:M23ase beta-sheet core domain-containing protein n=2 Tax=Herbiconiux moechotypicola TaxID=637393 RepID=A0ABN3D9A1_9MICO